MADRFFAADSWRGGLAALEGEEARHLARVRRVGVGDLVDLFDGKGGSARAEVLAIGRDRVELRVVGEGPPGRDRVGSIILAIAVPKGDRFDWLVEKATEIGVTRLVPILAERSSVDPREAKLERLRRMIVEASKQSGRNRLMKLAPPATWPEWLASGSGGCAARYLAEPNAPAPGVGPAPDPAEGVTVAVGPEGGFTPAEVDLALADGYRAIRLGPTILRVETAAVVALAAVLAGIAEPAR